MGCAESKDAKPAAATPTKQPVKEEKTVEEPAAAAPAAETPAEPKEETPAPAPTPEAPAAPAAAAPAPTPAPAAAPRAAPEPVDDGRPLTGRPSARQKVFLTMEKARLTRQVNDAAIQTFMAQYDQLVEGKDLSIPEVSIQPADMIPTADSLPEPEGDLSAILAKTTVLKLNGGLGTGMGLSKAKSLLEVKEGKKFLDFIVEQVDEAKKTISPELSFILMNSFSTEADTKAFLESKGVDVGSWTDINLRQNKVPKIDQETLEPAAHSDDELNWCPPGHGDLYAALFGSGKLAEMVASGKEYLFVSNSDNLGATLDTKILKWFADSDKEFLMEVCQRTEADKKGGHLAKRGAGLVLREVAQCPEADLKDFQDIQKHRFFNTNNLWIKLPSLKKVLAQNGGLMKLPVIKNSKTVDPTDFGSAKVYQLETAMGSAIQSFGANAEAVVVSRDRFAPVKTCGDLLAVRSDAYEVTPEKTLKLAPECGGKPPTINLGADYKLVQKLEELTGGYAGIPSLKGCSSLILVGLAPLKFSPGTTLTGDVSIDSGSHDSTQTLPAGEYSGDVLPSAFE